MGIRPNEQYSECVRSFCISLHNKSPNAYRLFRKEFDHAPAPVTIRSWLSMSNANPKAGILQQSMEILRGKVAEKREQGEELIGKIIASLNIYNRLQLNLMILCVCISLESTSSPCIFHVEKFAFIHFSQCFINF